MAATGTGGLAELLAMRANPSWPIRRDVIAALAALGDVAVAPLCASLVSERSDETVIAATVDALVGSTGKAEALVSALSRDEDPAVVADVAQVLGRRRHRESLPILAELSQHPNDNVAVAAIEGLGRVGGRAVVDLLVQAVERRHFFRTFAAIDVLAKSGDPRAIAPLVALLESPHYFFEAVRALGRTGDRAAVPALAPLLASPADGHVRVAAAALHELRQSYTERFGSAAPIDEALRRSAPSTAGRRLGQCWEGADGNEQASILVVFGCLREESAIPVLLGALDGPGALAKTAAEVLGWLAADAGAELIAALRAGRSAHRLALLPTVSQTRIADAVVECLRDSDPRVRRLACESLSRIGNPSAVGPLFEALGDENPAVVQAATAAIISLAGNGTEQLAVRAAQANAASVRRAAIRILSSLARLEAAQVLERATADDDPRVRDAAIQGLALLESHTSLGKLLELAQSSDDGVRASALRALGETSAEPRVAAVLLAALSDQDAWVRYYACQSLGKLRVASSVPAVAALVHDAAGQVRVAALEALSHLPGQVAFEALRDAAVSAEPDVRRAALIGLGLSKRAEAVRIVAPHASSEDIATRLIALSALAHFEAAETLVALQAAAREADDTLRTAAIGLLAQSDALDATRVLCALLNEPAARDLARAALCSLRPYRAQGISSVLRYADDELAVELTRILARLNQPDATAALFEALTSPNTSARKAAATTLGAVGSREALGALRRLAEHDPDPEVRRVCALVMAQ